MRRPQPPKLIALATVLLLSLGAVLSCGDPEGVEIDGKGIVAPIEKIKAGFIYLGPIGDYGWSASHDIARKSIGMKYSDWLETVFVESVPENDARRYIDRLINEENCNVIFATSDVYENAMLDSAIRYPHVIFMQCAGTKKADNLGTYFADVYQIYYVNGIMAGALTKTGKVGYVASHKSSEVIRHIDAFALGVKVASPASTIDIAWVNSWYDPPRAREAAEALIAKGVDTLAFTEDSPAVVQAAQASTDRGNPVYVFGHYSPMQQFGETSVVSGHIVDWTGLYEKILTGLHTGSWSNDDLWWRAAEGAAQLGAEIDKPVNPRFADALKAVTIKTGAGFSSAYDFALREYGRLKNGEFEPFTGPISDPEGNIRLAANHELGKEELQVLDWFVDNVKQNSP